MNDVVVGRPWSVFVDVNEPRIVMTAQSAEGGRHWTGVRIDQQYSTDRVTVWVDADKPNAPIMIEASGGPGLGELEIELADVIGAGDLWSPTLGDPDFISSWVWWHDSLGVAPRPPSGPIE